MEGREGVERERETDVRDTWIACLSPGPWPGRGSKPATQIHAPDQGSDLSRTLPSRLTPQPLGRTGQGRASDSLSHPSRPQDPKLNVDVWAELPLGPSGWGDLEEPKAHPPPHGPAPSGLDLFHRLLLLDHSLADHRNEDVSLMISAEGAGAMG